MEEQHLNSISNRHLKFWMLHGYEDFDIQDEQINLHILQYFINGEQIGIPNDLTDFVVIPINERAFFTRKNYPKIIYHQYFPNQIHEIHGKNKLLPPVAIENDEYILKLFTDKIDLYCLAYNYDRYDNKYFCIKKFSFIDKSKIVSSESQINKILNYNTNDIKEVGIYTNSFKEKFIYFLFNDSSQIKYGKFKPKIGNVLELKNLSQKFPVNSFTISQDRMICFSKKENVIHIGLIFMGKYRELETISTECDVDFLQLFSININKSPFVSSIHNNITFEQLILVTKNQEIWTLNLNNYKELPLFWSHGKTEMTMLEKDIREQSTLSYRVVEVNFISIIPEIGIMFNCNGDKTYFLLSPRILPHQSTKPSKKIDPFDYGIS